MTSLDLAVSEARERYRTARPESAQLDIEAKTVMPGGNTRSVLDFEPFPFRVASVDGPYLIDVDGHRYLDLLGNYSAGLLGHSPIEVRRAVSSALERGWSSGAMRPSEIEFARLVCMRFPSIEQVRFTNSGTEANLMAIATAKHATGRSSVLAFHHAYHGGVLYFGEGGRPLLVPHDWVMARYNDLPSVEVAFEAGGDEIAFVIVEPMLAASGCIPGKPEFLAGLRSITESAGSVLVFDEVMTSRLSPGGAQQALGITPDMTTLGKYIAGGLTIGAFGGKRELMSVFDPDSGGTLTHGGTFNNNEISAAAGIAALAEMLTPEVIETVNNRGDRLREALNSVFESAALPMCVTGLGSLMTVHVSRGPVQFPEDIVGSDDRLKELLFLEMLEQGFYMARRGFMALSIDVIDEDLDSLIAVVSEWADRARGLSG